MTTVSPAADNAFFVEFLDEFFAECEEHLVLMRRNLLELEASVQQPRVDQMRLDALFRSFHSLKGLAGMVGAGEVEQLAHEVENYLRVLRQPQMVLTAQALDTLIAATAVIEQALAALRTHQSAPEVAAVLADLAQLVERSTPEPATASTPSAATDRLTPGEQERMEAALAQGGHAWWIEFTPASALSERGITVNTVRERLQAYGTLIRGVPQVTNGQIAFEFLVVTQLDPAALAQWAADGLRAREIEPPRATASGQTESAAGTAANSPSVSIAPSNLVRVDIARLDELMQLVGELVISRARLANRLERIEAQLTVGDWRALQETNQMFERQLRDLREGVMRARMVPIGEVFARMQFVVRDLARESGKQIRIELQGQETEIDKLVVERMVDPLLHLVRNAVSHGLEAPEERLAAGKRAEGRLALQAAAAGDLVTITVEDDGRGIHLEQVSRQATALGLMSAGEPLDDGRLLDIICQPGFSTRDSADRVSGRGVGMAAVQQIVQELGGTLYLHSEVGCGTRFAIQLPLTVSIVDALIVELGSQTFAIPLPGVREIIDVQPQAVTVLENNELIAYRGAVLPLVRPARLFALESAASNRYALVVGQGRQSAALLVDRVRDKREIVVRPLADPLVQSEGFAGATELGNGCAVLILDAAGLVQLAHQGRRIARPASLAKDQGTAMSRASDPSAEAETFILFELAGTTYGLRSNDVQQMEMVEQITPVPNAPPAVEGVVFSRGQLIPVLNLRARFGMPAVAHTLRSRLVVVRLDERRVGLIVDSAREFAKIPTDMIQPPPETIAGLSGKYLQSIARLGERLVLILDLPELLNVTELLEPASMLPNATAPAA